MLTLRLRNCILVTGCAGFIGWKVSQFLLDEGHFVLGVDNLNNAYSPLLKQWRLDQLKHIDRFRFYLLDITEPDIEHLFQESEIKAVINLAARTGIRQSLQDPLDYYKTNVLGTLNLLELCRKYGVEKFVLASTSSVYGANKRPFDEQMVTDQPLSPYAASKKSAEVLSYVYHHLYGLDVSVLRYFTVYGPAGRPDMSILRFIKQIVEGESVVIYGDGYQERDFTYIDDIAIGTIKSLRPLGYEIINLGNNSPVKILEVVHLIEEIVGRKAFIKYEPSNPADPFATWADIVKAQTLLGWQPEVSLHEGLRRTIEWYKDNRELVRRVI